MEEIKKFEYHIVNGELFKVAKQTTCLGGGDGVCLADGENIYDDQCEFKCCKNSVFSTIKGRCGQSVGTCGADAVAWAATNCCSGKLAGYGHGSDGPGCLTWSNCGGSHNPQTSENMICKCRP